jgi:hypothetical protein
VSKGDFAVGAVVDFMFTTYGYTGPTTLSGGAVAVYKGNDLTQITGGVTLTLDFDGLAGMHHARVNTAGDAAFVAGEVYHLAITAGTVDGETRVGTILDSFTLEKTAALRPATAGRTIDVDASGDVDLRQTAADKVWASSARTLTSFGTLVADVVAGVWAAATRTLTAFGFVGDVADAVWDETAADHNTAGTMGAKMNTAASGTDPLANAVPGSYAAGTAGYKIGQLGFTTVNFTAPVLANGNAQLVRGADYYAADGNALEWNQTALNAAWPDLTGATVALTARTPGGAALAFSVAAIVVTPSGSNKAVRVEIPRTLTAELAKGAYPFVLAATLSNGHVVPLFHGHILFVDAFPA